MIQAASRVIFCLDHTKFGRRSVARLCDISVIDVIVTDSSAPMDLVSELRENYIEVVIAEHLTGLDLAHIPAEDKENASLVSEGCPQNRDRQLSQLRSELRGGMELDRGS